MTVEFSSVRLLAREFGRVPFELKAELRPRLHIAASALTRKIQGAAGFSSRIPGAVRTSVAFGSRTGGVRVYVDQRKAPHARPLENSGKPGTFRHPVFGNRENWVSQPAHPFFFPSVESSRGLVSQQVEAAVRASFPRGTGI